MKFIEDKVEFVPQESGFEGVYKMMELAARTCYKTENSIKEGSAHNIIDNVIIPSGHTSVLEFGTVYLTFPNDGSTVGKKTWHKYLKDRYSRVNIDDAFMDIGYVYVTTTYRSILQGDYEDPIEAIENHFDKDWKDDLKYLSDVPTDKHYKRYCYRFVMDRVGSQSVERHRGVWGVSYAQESTRYINYDTNKWSHELTFCLPSKFYDLINEYSNTFEELKNYSIEEKLDFLRTQDRGWNKYENSLRTSEKEYMSLVGEEGWKPEEARGTLNLDIKTEFLMCAYPEDWKMFCYRRDEKHAHPQIQRIAKKVVSNLKEKNVL